MFFVLFFLFGTFIPGTVKAQPAVSVESSCPPGNLLSGRRPTAQDVRRDLGLLTDGNVGPEGAMWDAGVAVILDTGASSVTWDLGEIRTLDTAYLQGDGNDTYQFWGSLDGKTWKTLGEAAIVSGDGLKGRKVTLGREAARYLKVGEGKGDSFFSLSEVQAFCQSPATFPPPVKVIQSPIYKAPWSIFSIWNDEVSARWELAMALLGLVALRLRHGRWRKWRDRGLAVLGVLAALTYINFGSFHFGNYLHNWEWFHYYTGSKYFQELGYERLYECTAIADSEDGLRRRVELRKMTNLRTNLLETTEKVLAHPEECKKHFSADRWQSFKKDITFFRSREGAQRWDDAQTDHGYNGTPVWNIAGTLLANLSPASLTQIVLLSLFDQAFYFGMMAVVWWGFGWRTLAVGMIAFASNFPSRFYWTGGAFLRWDWLFFLVAAMACLKKEKYALGGAALGYSTLLRIFPGLTFAGPVLAAGITLWRDRKLDPRWMRFFSGAALAVALLVPLSFATSGGPQSYVQFVQNTMKHKETPLTNYMGLRTVVAYRPKEVGRLLRDLKQTDPWKVWKEARIRAFTKLKPLYAMAVIAYLVLLGYAVRRRVEPWVAAALGATCIAVGVELTCYYYAFIIAVAVLWHEREEAGELMLMLTAFTQFAAWAPLPRMATWIDEQYTLMSVGTVVAFCLILWNFVQEKKQTVAEVLVPAMQTVGGASVPDSLQISRSVRKRRRRR